MAKGMTAPKGANVTNKGGSVAKTAAGTAKPMPAFTAKGVSKGTGNRF